MAAVPLLGGAACVVRAAARPRRGPSPRPRRGARRRVRLLIRRRWSSRRVETFVCIRVPQRRCRYRCRPEPSCRGGAAAGAAGARRGLRRGRQGRRREGTRGMRRTPRGSRSRRGRAALPLEAAPWPARHDSKCWKPELAPNERSGAAPGAPGLRTAGPSRQWRCRGWRARRRPRPPPRARRGRSPAPASRDVSGSWLSFRRSAGGERAPHDRGNRRKLCVG